MESSSLLAAVSDVLCDVLGLNYVLNILGLAEVIAKAGETGEVVEEVISEKVEAAVEVVEEVFPEEVEAAVVEVVKEEVKGNRRLLLMWPRTLFPRLLLR